MTINSKEKKIYEDNQSAVSFYILFAFQFLLVAGGMFVNIKTGISTSLWVLLMTPFILSRCSSLNFDLSRIRNGMTGLFVFLCVFYLLEIGNPNNVQEAWNISITHYAIYPIAMAILVPVAIRDRKGIEWLLFIWSVFILIASMKGDRKSVV